jgi:hypothetical protein
VPWVKQTGERKVAKAPFQDPDLHTPAHDAIMMWLEENAADVVEPHCRFLQRAGGEVSVEVVTIWEKPVIYAGGVRYIDMVIEANVGGREFRLLCEVKPVIRSIGELIRQLRQYEPRSSHGGTVCVAIVSPDDRFRAIIEKQGFIFIKAPQPEYGPQGGLF